MSKDRKDFGSMSNATLIAVVGIGVSGVIGPMATAWATRKANRQQFEQDQAAKRRADLRDLIDEAAVLLGSGGTNLRVAREEAARGGDEPPEVREWARKVHLLKQRLLLRLPFEHTVMSAYDAVLTTLEAVGSADSENRHREALASFETANEGFLKTAREALDAPIAKPEGS